MAPPNFPIVNGNLYSFASAEITFAGRRFRGITAINWKEELTPEDVYGNGAVPIGRTKGEYKASGDVEQVKNEYDALIAMLGNGYGEKAFTIGVSYNEPTGAGLSTVEIIGARIISPEASNARGPAGTTVKYGLSIIVPIKTNGRTIIDTSLSQGGLIGTLTAGLSFSL